MENKISTQISNKTVLVSALAAGAIAGILFYILNKDQVKTRKKSIKKEVEMKDLEEISLERPDQAEKKVEKFKKVGETKVKDVKEAQGENVPLQSVEEKIVDPVKAAAEAKASGNKLFTAQRYVEAKELYSKAIEFNPDPVYYSNRAACYSMLKDYENVVNDCTLALGMDRKYVKALSRRALAYEHLGKLSDALNDYTAVCVLEQFKNEASLGATDRFLKKIATQEAQEIMKTKKYVLPSDTFIRAFLDSFSQTSSGISKVLEMETFEESDILVKDAFRFIKERKWENALSSINQALESAVDSLSPTFEALALNLRGTFNFLIGKVDDAVVDIEKSCEIDPTSINTLIKKATLYMERTEVEKSVSVFEEAVNLDPNHPDVYYHRGQVRFLVGDFSGAASDYKKAISLDPENLYSYIQLGVAQYKLGETERTKKTFEKALKKFPNSHEIHNYFGEILLDQQKFDQALEELDKAIELDPTSALAYINKAILFLQVKQDPKSAEESCRKAVEVDPLSDVALMQLAQLLCHQDKITEAISFYDKAIVVTRTQNEIVNIVSCREAARAQLFVTENYPEELAKLKPSS